MENIDKINFLGIYAKHIHYMLNRIHCEQNIFRGQIHELLDSSVLFVVSNVARLPLQLSLTFIHRKDSNIILRFYFPWLSLEIRTSRYGPLIKQEAFTPLNRQFLLPASVTVLIVWAFVILFLLLKIFVSGIPFVRNMNIQFEKLWKLFPFLEMYNTAS
jgi:hypothetical protein